MTVVALPTPFARRDDGRTRTRWSMGASIGLHALALLVLVLAPRPQPAAEPMTEITLLDPGDAGAPEAPVAAAPAAAVASPGVVLATAAEQRFRREAERAPVEPRPQDDAAYDDRIDARLAAMQASTPHVSAGVAVAAPTSLWGGAPATISGPSGGGPAVTLTRGAGLGGSPLPLARGGGGVGTAPAPAVAPAPRVDAEAATPAGGDAQARRTLAGATLMGPIADRAVLTHVTPVYPEWAKRDAVEGSVTLYFVVAPDGSVRENVVVQKTAGFGDFDENARAALRAWRFAPLTDGRVGEQWGTITFRFRLRDAG